MKIFKVRVGMDVYVGQTMAESIDDAAKQLGCRLRSDASLPEGFRELVFLGSWATMSGNLTIHEVGPYLSGMPDLLNVLSSFDELVELR